MKRSKHVGNALLAACSILVLAGCTRTHQVRKAEFSGFLNDYSQLRRGGRGEARWIYINPRAEFPTYNKIMFDRIAIWRAEGSQLAKVPPEDLQRLAAYLFRAMERELSPYYTIVGEPGPGVMRVRLAITEARKSRPVLDLATTVIPQALAVSAVKRLATGTHAFVGKASIEAEFVDSVSGERLVAGVDRRGGRKILRGKLRTWDDVTSAYDSWAKKTRERLVEMRTSKATWVQPAMGAGR